MLGFGVSQLFYGPLTDRFGRRSVLFISLAFYAIAAVLCVYAPTFELLIAARVFMGASAGGSRVIAVSAARDLYVGRADGEGHVAGDDRVHVGADHRAVSSAR